MHFPEEGQAVETEKQQVLIEKEIAGKTTTDRTQNPRNTEREHKIAVSSAMGLLSRMPATKM
jgi:hypothetical protein